jgi:hypothetical protein
MRFCTFVLCCTVFLALPLSAHRLEAQQSAQNQALVPAADTIPDSPTPQIEVADSQSGVTDPQSTPSQPSPQTPSQSSSNSAQSQQPASAQETQHEKAEEELKEQEKQRVAGVMATFNTTRNPNATPLSPGQKYRLFFRSAFDPWAFGLTAFVAGIGQAQDSNPQWRGGMEGYSKRWGAGYADYFMGNFFGNAVLPAWWHEDPRYFQKGTGSTTSRVLWAATSTVWCRRDNGTWGPNYANLAGNMIGAAIANVYYPESERTVSDTITRGLTVSAEGIVGSEVIEFWPDMVRRYRRKKAEKLARQAAQPARSSVQSPSGSAGTDAKP